MKTALVLGATIGLGSAARNLYNEERAFRGKYYSSAAYCLKETIEDWGCGIPCDYFPGNSDPVVVNN